MSKALYSIRETASQLSVSPDVVRQQIKAGRIRAVRIGLRVLISAEEIVRIAQEGCGAEGAKQAEVSA